MKLFLLVLVFGVFLQVSTGWWWGRRRHRKKPPEPVCLSVHKGSWSPCNWNQCRETQSRSITADCNKATRGSAVCQSICQENPTETRECYPTNCQPGDFCCPKRCEKPVPNCEQMTCSAAGLPECKTCSGYSNRGAEFSRFWPNGKKSCIPTCSEESHSCWPGTCGRDHLARSCRCNPGFKIKKTGSSTECELETKPRMFTCTMGVNTKNGNKANSTSIKCNMEDNVFINFQPENIYFKTEAQFIWQLNVTQPSHVIGYGIGIVGGEFSVKQLNADGIIKKFRTVELTEKNICSKKFSEMLPLTEKVLCVKSIDLPKYTINHGDKLCVTFTVFGGGYLNVKKIGSNQNKLKLYQKTSNHVTKCFVYDILPPKHCIETRKCLQEPVQLKSRITKSDSIAVSFDGWSDSVPKDKSRITSYELTIHEVNQAGKVLRANLLDKLITFSTTNQTRTRVKFPRGPALFALYLSVQDLAKNIQNARRFVLFDNSSKIEMIKKNRPRVLIPTGEEDPDPWYSRPEDVCITWEKYFRNSFLREKLQPILKDNCITEQYDQTSGILNVHGTWNIDGISEFRYRWQINEIEPTALFTHPQTRNQSVCIRQKLEDSDRLKVQIIAVDILGRHATKNLTVLIDRSPPIIEDIGLIKGGHENVYIHNSTDLSKMILKFKAMDKDSGLKRIQWSLGSTKGGDDIGSGGLAVVTLSEKETCPPESCCYCLVVSRICQMNNYTLTLNSLTTNGTHMALHNRRYYFVLKADNNAGLQGEEDFTIAVDESPPEVGIVLEGLPTMPDMDFTGDDTIIVHWEGFIDHESGISHYLVAVAGTCIGKELQNGCRQCNLSVPLFSTEETFAKISFPSTGKYFTTVVAFNFAMEPSDPICSDGVVFDKTPPRIVDVSLSGAKTLEDITCHNGKVWRINSDLTKSRVNNRTSCTVQCDPITAEELVDLLKERNKAVNQNVCPRKRDVQEQRIIGIPSDTIHLTWNYEESETDLLDFYVGVGSDVSEKQHPDVIAYTSTNQKSEFRKHHLGIDAGVSFYVFISAINRAMLSQTVTFGPIIIDQSPPLYNKGNLNVSVGHDTLTLLWSNNTFYDPQQKDPFIFYYHIKNINTDEFVTPLQRYNGQTLYKNGLAFIELPLQLHNSKQFHSTIYACELHVFNMVGLFTTVMSPKFQIPVKESFDQGKLIDIDPNMKSSTKDIDFHNQTSTACVRLEGFRDDVQIQLGIGTTSRSANLIHYQSITNRSIYCIQNEAIESFRTYYAILRVSFQGKTSIVASDGFAIINTNITDLIKVYVGECNMSKTIAINLNQKNNIHLYTLHIMEDIHIGQEYSVILNTVDPRAELSGDGLKVVGSRTFITGLKTYLTFMALSRRPLLRIRLKTPVKKVSIALSGCSLSQHFQKSTKKLSAFWTVSDRYAKYVTHFQAGVIDQTCVSNNGGEMCTLKDFKNIGRVFNFTQRHLNLISGHAYSFSVRACMRAVGCTKRVFSLGTIVLNKPPNVGQLNAQLNKIDNRFSFIAIQWTAFSCISGSHVTNPVAYEVAVTDSHRSELVAPKIISNDTSKTEFTCQYNISSLSTGKVNVSLVTFCLSGLSTKISTLIDEVRDRKSNTDSNVCVYEYDANKQGVNQQNWEKDSFSSKRFCNLNAADSIALSTGRIGAGVVGKNIEKKTWYLMSVAQTPEDDCSGDRYCVRSAIGQAGSNSVQFDMKGLRAEKMYFICVRGTKYRISGELQHFNVCGNGFMVDGTLPEKGQVTVENAFNGFVSDHSLVVSWQGFIDRCTQCSQLFTPKIASYSYFIGTYPKQEDIAVSKDVGRRSHVVHKNLSIADGQKIFVGVRAYDLSGQSVEAISDGVIVDRSPPLTGTLYTGSVMAHDYYVDTNELTIYWNGFLDEHSEISSYQLGIGNKEGKDNVIPFQEQHLDFSEIQSKKSLLDGHEYYAILKVTNGAGLVTTAVSDIFRVDSSPPLMGVIIELSPEGLGDISYQREITSLHASWFDFNDPHTGILFYRVGVGSLPLHDDVIAMASVGNKTDAVWHKDFVPGVKYYVTVEACNRAFVCSKTSSNGVIMDNSPPLAGFVELGMNGQHPGYQAHRSLLNVRWAGFHDPHSGMQKFLYCIGTAVRLCDVLSWKSALQETSTVITGIHLPLKKLLYVTVKGFNNVGLNITSSSSGFLVDDTPPIIQSEPRLLNADNTEVTTEVMTTADSSLLHVHWSFKDDESPIVEQFIRIHPHTSGMISLTNMRLPPLDRTTIQLKEKERLQDGSTYNISMTVCNAAGLCSSTASRQQILVDSTRPVMGKFLPEKLFWFQKGTVTCLNLTWDGFVDSESGIKQYHLFVRDSKGQFLTQPIRTDHSTKLNQFLSVNLTRKLSPSESIILEIMAENGIGLYSKIFKITADLFCSSRVADFGYLDIQTHSCPIQYCNNDCTCASQGKKCDSDEKTKCKQLKNAERRIKLRVQSVNDVTASSRCLSAHWTIPDVKQARRIEWSVGINGSEIGTGVFNLLKENPWQDVGIQDHVVYCLPSGQSLETGEWYAFYLRVWYSFDKYAIFTSENSVQADLTSPIVRRGARISDAVGSCEEADVDYISKVKTIGACWKNVFLDTQSSIDKYIVMTGTAPGMGDLIAPLTIAPNKTQLFKETDLNKGTKYYFTVIAINTLGLFTIHHSNGFVFDDEPPTNGIVYNTDSYRNSPHQNLQGSFGISWHGFQDAHSGIKEYQVAMGLAGSGLRFTSAGIATSYTFTGISTKHKDHYVGYVKAVDAAGHTSDIIQSKVVFVDKTPPESVECEIFSRILTKQYNESESRENNTGRFSGGEFAISVDLTFNEFYDLKFIIPSYSKNQNTMLQIGNETMNVPFTISGPISVLQHRFLSRFEGKTNISLKFFACKSYPKTLKLSLSKCTSGKKSSINGINLKQISPTLILVSFNFFDEESGVKRVSIGAGTTVGGFQINKLRKVSASHGPHIIYSLSLPHGQLVYVTLLIENSAGLESVINKKLMIDHSPSRIDIISSFLYHHEENKENVIKAHWTVEDLESKVEECYYGIGTKSGSIDVKDWTISPANHSIWNILTSPGSFNGSLYLTVMCTNEANLLTRKVSKVPAESRTSIPELKFHIIPTNTWSGVNYTSRVQSDPNQLDVQIDQYGRSDDTHKCRVLEDSHTLVDWMEIGHRYHFTLQNLTLKQGGNYQVEIRKSNNEKMTVATKSIIIDSTRPQLTGSPVTIEKQSPSTFKVQWNNVFEENQFQSTRYVVSIGTAKATANIVHQRETLETNTVFNLNYPGTIYISLTAVYETALFTSYSQVFNI